VTVIDLASRRRPAPSFPGEDGLALQILEEFLEEERARRGLSSPSRRPRHLRLVGGKS